MSLLHPCGGGARSCRGGYSCAPGAPHQEAIALLDDAPPSSNCRPRHAGWADDDIVFFLQVSTTRAICLEAIPDARIGAGCRGSWPRSPSPIRMAPTPLHLGQHLCRGCRRRACPRSAGSRTHLALRVERPQRRPSRNSPACDRPPVARGRPAGSVARGWPAGLIVLSHRVHARVAAGPRPAL